MRVSLERNASASTTITKLNAFDCTGQYVVHEVDAFLYTQVADPVQAAQVGLWVCGFWVSMCIVHVSHMMYTMYRGVATPPPIDWAPNRAPAHSPITRRPQPALNLEWALGGEWDSFRLVPGA